MTISWPFPIRWTHEGIVYNPSGAHRAMEGGDPLLTARMDAVVLRWRDWWSLKLEEPWPRAALKWEQGIIQLAPKSWLLGGQSPGDLAASLEALVTHLEAHAPYKVRARGWLDLPVQPWERVAGMPEPRQDERLHAERLGEGAFRSAPRPVEEVAVAVRHAPDAMEAMLDWLASTEERPWREHPREVRIGEQHLYARRRDKSTWRLPLSSLRARRGEPDADAVYVFGRHTALVLPIRTEPCPVRKHLDASLEAGRTR